MKKDVVHSIRSVIASNKKAPTSAKPGTISMRVFTLVAVIVPFCGLIASIVFLWGWGLSWVELMLLGVMYLLTGFGITIGYHRLFTHRSFETNSVVQTILAVLGSMAAQGPLIMWVAFHRQHHQHSDKHDDPHSPHNHGNGIFGLARGLWHAHLGWLFQSTSANITHYAKDLRQSTLLRTINMLFPLWVVLGLMIPTGLGFWLIGGWVGALLGLLWGGLVRIFFVHHVTWSVNSICHLWGQRPYPNQDESRNNFVVGVLGMGEGWHNNHHSFPTSARHGFRWWEIDISFWMIQLMALLGLAWNVKLQMSSPSSG